MNRLNRFAITMPLALVILAGAAATARAQDSDNERAVRAYYSGFETHNWNLVAGALADGFTFTTPVNDHLAVKDFKDTCWGTSKFTKKVNLVKMVPSGDDLIVLVEISTTDNKLVRNMDRYTFSGGKIKSVEVFFGPGESFPGNHK
jgi:hypothetical protein